MADDKYTFEQARIRLEEIAAEVRKKDTSLEKSLDLLEEGVRLANICTELVDHTDTSASVVVPGAAASGDAGDGEGAGTGEVDETGADFAPESQAAPIEDVDDEADGFDDADETAGEAEAEAETAE